EMIELRRPAVVGQLGSRDDPLYLDGTLRRPLLTESGRRPNSLSLSLPFSGGVIVVSLIVTAVGQPPKHLLSLQWSVCGGVSQSVGDGGGSQTPTGSTTIIRVWIGHSVRKRQNRQSVKHGGGENFKGSLSKEHTKWTV